MKIREAPGAKVEMVVRKPVAEVFGACVNNAITTKFLFTKSSAKLKLRKRAASTLEMYNASGGVYVESNDKNRRVMAGLPYHGTRSQVEDGVALVGIANSGFKGR